MEAVQAVQLPDNSIPLIGFKSTFVRVYLKSDSSIDITGYLITDTPEGHAIFSLYSLLQINLLP